MIRLMLLIAALDDEQRDFFASLFQDNFDVMARIAFRASRNSTLAEDAIMKTFEKLISQPELILKVPQHKRKYYLLTTVKNMAIEIYRKTEKIVYKEPEIINEILNKEDTNINYVNEMNDSELLAHIQNLPDLLKSIIAMKYYQGLENKEIAEQLGIPANAVRSYVSRALKYLKRDIGGKEGFER